jgi:Glucodextranase, domain B
MQGSIRRLALVVSLSLILHGLFPAQLRAQQTENDSDDPKFVKISPASGTVIAASDVTITGRIEDASPVEVAVGDVKAKADGKGRFTLKGVPLKQGKNTITLVATDAAGNEEESELELIGKDLVPPVAPVVFAVKPTTRLAYQIVEGRSEPESRVVISGGAKPALADSAYGTGLFTAFVRLREGRNDLTVVALDDAGASPPVRVSIERTGAGTPLMPEGAPAQINISSGATQRALPDTDFPRPLVALVTDARGLPVEGVRVEFTVRFGDARFAGGHERDSARTDETGRASVRLGAGKDFGINLVRADFDGNTSSPAAFDVETIEPRGDKETSVSGVMLDMFGHPLEGAIVRLGKRTIKAARDGRFTMQKVEPGADQRLEVFGDDINSGGHAWSDASYPIDVLAGADNSLGRPLFVSPLNEGPPLGAGEPFALDAEGRVTSKGAVLAWHDDYGRDVVPEVSLLRGVRVTAVPPATLDGRKFSATLVLSERVPVTLDDGLATGLNYFIQPRAVVFDQPLPFKFPNSDKLPPRSRVLVMHYDERAGSWKKEGTARVGDDGKAVVNEDGSGIRGGGWYAFPGEKTQPEFTNVDFIQIEGNPRFEGATITHLEVYSEGKSAVMATAWGEGDFKRLHFRVTVPALNGEPIFDNKGMEPGDPSRAVEVTVTPISHVMEPGDRLILFAVGRPHPGGYYVWSSADPSIASVEPFVSDGGAEHPNRANVIAHRHGTVKISAMYITPAGATSVGSSEVICRQAKPR